MNYEQLLSFCFSCFHGVKNIFFCKAIVAIVCIKSWLIWRWLNLITYLLFGFKSFKKYDFYRLPAEFKSAGKNRETPRRHLFFLICDCNFVALSWCLKLIRFHIVPAYIFWRKYILCPNQIWNRSTGYAAIHNPTHNNLMKNESLSYLRIRCTFQPRIPELKRNRE